MTKAVSQLAKQAESLTDQERYELITMLLGQIDEAVGDEEPLPHELKSELDRRLDYLDTHPNEGVSPEEAVRIAREHNRKKAGK
ncbi:MAG: addiction module protein [Planctomycetes bacterium]|nr:addiction module protein [Planctomycetota bacterium]